MTDTTTRLLTRLLDEPTHLAALRSLEPRRFVALVRSVSLEDAGELLAMATAPQTLAMLDEELWRSDSGVQERFDHERFAIWLEVLLEGGDALAAQALREVPEELLTAALCGQLFVLHLDALGHDMAGASWDEAELAERILDECLYLELDRYTLVARHPLGWDPTIAALLALDRVDHGLVQRVLGRCHDATMDELRDLDEGLGPVLRAQQTIEDDARAEREDRRARRGYVSRASAKSFLALAAETSRDDPGGLAEDAITRAYFREIEVASKPGRTHDDGASPPPSLRALVEHLDASDGAVTDAPALPAAARRDSDEDPAIAAFRQAMRRLHSHDPERHAEQLARLVYLANVLVAAGKPDGSAYALLEASRDALATTAAGFERLYAQMPRDDAWSHLQRVGVDGLFRLGWRSERTTK